jgi:choline dehydrogenase-like flavoprotein
VLNGDLKSSYDAIVVGSGAGGSTLALRLGQYGRRVLVVEKGIHLRPQRSRPSDPVGVHLRRAMVKPSCWPVGGQTKFYGAALYRLRESDFQAIEHEVGTSPAWPISYWDLEPYYQQAEDLYRVHGSPDGDPSEPPRTRPFPHLPLPHGPIVSEVVGRLEASGTSVSAIPKALDYGPGGKCVLCATCDAYYCQLDAKMDAEIAALRPALATGNVQLATRTVCSRVLTNGAGSRVTGVVLRQGSVEFAVNAQIVVVSAGLEETAALLRRSRTSKHPEGLGNDCGCLGRYLAGHSVGTIFPLVSWAPIPPIHTKTFAMNAYYGGAPHWPHPLGVVQVAGQLPFWEEVSWPIRPIARFIGAHSLMCFYMSEALPTYDSGVIFDGDQPVGSIAPAHNTRTFGELRLTARDMFHRAGYWTVARRKAPTLWHPVGTARMGVDDRSSVVDANCQVHEIEGLFVADASVLPSAGSVNPALTVIALALRAGDFIAGLKTS